MSCVNIVFTCCLSLSRTAPRVQVEIHLDKSSRYHVCTNTRQSCRFFSPSLYFACHSNEELTASDSGRVMCTRQHGSLAIAELLFLILIISCLHQIYRRALLLLLARLFPSFSFDFGNLQTEADSFFNDEKKYNKFCGFRLKFKYLFFILWFFSILVRVKCQHDATII